MGQKTRFVCFTLYFFFLVFVEWGSQFALFWFLLIRIQIIEIQLLVWCGHWTHWFVWVAFLYCLNVDIWTRGFHRKIAPAKIQSLYGSWRKQRFVKGSLSRAVRLRKYPLGVHPLYYIRPCKYQPFPMYIYYDRGIDERTNGFFLVLPVSLWQVLITVHITLICFFLLIQFRVFLERVSEVFYIFRVSVTEHFAHFATFCKNDKNSNFKDQYI